MMNIFLFRGFTRAKKQSKTALTPNKVKKGLPHLQTENEKKQKCGLKQHNDNVHSNVVIAFILNSYSYCAKEDKNNADY